MNSPSHIALWLDEFRSAWKRAVLGGLLGGAALILLILCLTATVLLLAHSLNALFENLGILRALVPAGMLASSVHERILQKLRRSVAISWYLAFFTTLVSVWLGIIGAIILVIGWLLLAIIIEVFCAAFGIGHSPFSISSIWYAGLAGVVIGALGGLYVGPRMAVEELMNSDWDAGKVMERWFPSSHDRYSLHDSSRANLLLARCILSCILSGGFVTALLAIPVIVFYLVIVVGVYCASAALCAAVVASTKVVCLRIAQSRTNG
jgi:hypothetical protein